MLQQSASQTVGPYFSIGMIYGELNNMVKAETLGEVINIRGRVFDGNGKTVDDAVVEIWQADTYGIYSHPNDKRQAEADPNFFGHGRAGTNDDGEYWFKTIKPGRIGDATPHINVRIFMRGLLLHTITRLYFADEDNSADEIFASVPAERQHTITAEKDIREGTPTYLFDIHMQGDNET
ncbi:MAG: protocatechuate 3,4-dioxygenase subunit alpha, partial [Chloroflexota bacterium]